ncbi:MAG: pyruvate kinase [Betaproteobacteria bacterium]|jgi:pyruvate kinase|nr:pyruvate kinase [Rhodocyclaceae bacterium]MCA3133917.1 pyruvate kinase [Rhodocyclaceae bacterium]MCA3142041.1 pyruvate kinase [Rhodocyclaceae bacterium]MCA3147187.1 pyruvate kinase [Rhodocyclaceae bacterium]MCE2899548.1 pyruvate kinase [Betaproteobacteria bacterium]
MQRSTKIVATLGPASSEKAVLRAMVAAGVDVVRMNFSHGLAEDHLARADLVREVSRELGRTVGIMVDLQGPKIRIGKFDGGRITLADGAAFVLDAECGMGDSGRVGLDYRELPNDVRAGDELLLDDGRITLKVQRVEGASIHTLVTHGGELSNNKGINRRGGGLTAPALTAKDMDDIRVAARMKADFLAVSFPKSGSDMYMARELMRAAGGKALLVAKIERTEAVKALEEILEASDAIMVARGDLAVEVGDAAVPALQKRMIRLARERNKLTITATQMMESMISSSVPTRAEVSDVANAVLDGTDAVMLSAETAAGKYPVHTVEAMARVCLEAEKSADLELDREFLNRVFTRVDQSIAMGALFTAFHLKVKCIAALTQSGSTALWMSRVNCGVPIYALTPEIGTRYRLTLFRDVYPLMIQYFGSDREQLLLEAERQLKQHGAVQDGDLIVLTIGEPIGKSGGTNTLKIVRVGEHGD